mmetsp:Transcript_38618/g.46742  ORF Transcript_38618/g.46742 Transcript_38618/m.46742 type:complete len:696 (+) Transcript_38618:167-2254(+)|eukprot:CAMPEP_0197857700 /NCGR_PEP_ID=MMETSP1438-20131217/31023_1 /TAXON_ID=1461541 /ORGANISM="Pterosperma sp., Strain CCMP1384" /LENGTH=695 /DNA_ID=CAMNT_0043473629 /DNA_START=167 /DNA_END=2254 /DNA_ORIENTATION=+
MGDVSFIVDRLNAAPFNLELSMVTFSEKDPQELLQCFSDIFAAINPNQARDIKSETQEEMTWRMLEFLRIVKYKPPIDMLTFRQGIAEGTTDVIYPVMKWLLPQVEALKKRAFVGYYLSDVPIPDDLVHDEDITELHKQIKEMQAEFVQSHKSLEGMRGEGKDPAKLKQKINLLEEEREQLQSKIVSTKTKVTSKVSGNELAELQELSTALRRQQEEELELQNSLRKEREKLDASENRYQRANTRLREIRNSAADGSSAALLAQLMEETSSNRYRVNEKLPKEMEKKQQRILTLQKVLAEPVNTESDLARLHRQREQLDSEVKALQEKANSTKNPYGDKADLQLRQQAQIQKSVAKKKEDILAKLDKLTERKRQLLAEYEEKASLAEESKGNILKGEDWKNKYEAVKSKLTKYKKLKKELDDLNAETLILSRTEGILQNQEKQVCSMLSIQEKKKGVAGFQETADSLEKVSAAKGEIDEQKGQTLEEISKFVTEINQVIKERKSKLAPQIKDLRAVRQKFQELETEHSEKKKTYEAASMGYESKKAKLETEVTTYRNEANADETKYHYMNCMSTITDVAIRRVTAGLESQALRDKYTKKVQQQEDMTKRLKVLQKHVKEAVEPNKNQIEMLKDLKKLLDCKINNHRKGNVGGMISGGVSQGGAQENTAPAPVEAMMISDSEMDAMSIGNANVMVL